MTQGTIKVMMTITGVSVQNEMRKHVDILTKTIKAGTMILTALGVAMTNTAVNMIKGMMTKKNGIGVIEKIDGA